MILTIRDGIELHPGHPFHWCALKVIAHAISNDDVLCAHSEESGCYLIIHLIWSGGEDSYDVDGNAMRIAFLIVNFDDGFAEYKGDY